MEDRKTILLKACLELLKKADESHYIIDVMSETVNYDGVDCDGYCLMEDIKTEVGFETNW